MPHTKPSAPSPQKKKHRHATAKLIDYTSKVKLPNLDFRALLPRSLSATEREQAYASAIQVRRFAGPQIHASALGHLRIAHLTDLHVGRVTPFAVQQAAVRITNASSPDLVVITGDFVCHSQLYLDQLTEVIRGFNAPVMAVLGNHDHWSGANEVRRALMRGGAEVLDNCNTTITLGHEQLQVVGLDDAYTGHANIAKAVKGMRRDVATIGLSHIAEEADQLWQHNVPLVLSGHTHAGQITVARLHELAIGKIAGHRYVHGLYGDRQVRGAVYVGAGIGASLITLRIGERARREITLFELGQQAPAVDEHHSEQTPLRGRAPSKRTKQRRHNAVKRKEFRRKKRL